MSDDPKSSISGVNDFMLAFILLFFGAFLFYATTAQVDKAVSLNLRMLAAGADQYFHNHPDTKSVASVDLIGINPSQYIMPFNSVAHEIYIAVIVKGQTITASSIAGARTVTYSP
jgi:hypothetical protein